MIRTLFAVPLAAVLAALPLSAQQFTGVYTTSNAQGGTVTLTLEQSAQGSVTGTLTGNGNTFQVQGTMEGSAVVGLVTNPQIGGMYFRADLAGGELVLTLVGIGADNQPDPSQTDEIRFSRQSGAVAQGEPAAPARPSGALGGAVTGSSSQDDPWVGTWQGGNLVITLQGGNGQYTGTATLQGAQYPLTAQGNATQLSGTYAYNGQNFPWQAQLRGAIMVMQVDGQTVQLQRGQAGQTAQAGQTGQAGQAGQPNGGNVAQLSPQGREWHQYLTGKRLTQMDSYYSGPAYDGAVGGGYSSRKRMDICSDGRFFYSSRSSVSASGDGVSGYSGGNGGDAGTWRIIEQGGQVGLEFRWADGSATQHLLEFRDNKTFLDGTRTFVTQDNQSCP